MPSVVFCLPGLFHRYNRICEDFKFLTNMTFFKIKIRQNCTVLVYLLLKVRVGRTCPGPWADLSRQVRFGYWLVTVLAFFDSTTVDKIFFFNITSKLIL